MVARNAFENLALDSTLRAGLFVSPSTSRKVGEQKFFIGGTGRLTLSVAGNFRAKIRNPVGSGKTVYVVRLGSMTTGTGWARLWINPPEVLTNTRVPINAVVGSAAVPVAEMTFDTNATTPLSGSDTGIDIGVPANQRLTLDLPPLILSAGVSLGVNIPFAGAADAAMSVYWYEE